MIKRYCKKDQNNGYLLVVSMHRVYKKLLGKNWNLHLNFLYFHFSARSITFLTAYCLSIFILSHPSRTVLCIDRSGL